MKSNSKNFIIVLNDSKLITWFQNLLKSTYDFDQATEQIH